METETDIEHAEHGAGNGEQTGPVPTGQGVSPRGQTEHGERFHRLGVQHVTAVALAADFRPIRILSRGGMGVILLAQELVTKRLVAIKVLNAETKDLLPLAQQFMREAVITARLQHPNIVPVYRLGFLDNDRSRPHLFFSMKFIEGSSYANVRTRLALAERIKVLAGVAAALGFAHGKKLWHRDLKPDNVMLGQHDDVYVVDWGLVTVTYGEDYRLDLPEVAMLDLVQPLPEQIDTLLKETPNAVTNVGGGTVLGTPLYMAPEQVLDERHLMGPASDVWALGVMLFEALCGHHPYVPDPDASSYEILTHTINPTVEPVSRVNPGAPPHLAALCDAMLSRARGDRPLANEVLEILRQPIELARGHATLRGAAAPAPPSPPGVPGIDTLTPILGPTVLKGMPMFDAPVSNPYQGYPMPVPPYAMPGGPMPPMPMPAMPMPAMPMPAMPAMMARPVPPMMPPTSLPLQPGPGFPPSFMAKTIVRGASAPFESSSSGVAPDMVAPIGFSPSLTQSCVYCGAAMHISAMYCLTCGRPLPPRNIHADLASQPERAAPASSMQRIETDTDGNGEARSVTIVSPTGFRVEGLTVDQALTLMKGLDG